MQCPVLTANRLHDCPFAQIVCHSSTWLEERGWNYLMVRLPIPASLSLSVRMFVRIWLSNTGRPPLGRGSQIPVASEADTIQMTPRQLYEMGEVSLKEQPKPALLLTAVREHAPVGLTNQACCKCFIAVWLETCIWLSSYLSSYLPISCVIGMTATFCIFVERPIGGFAQYLRITATNKQSMTHTCTHYVLHRRHLPI